MTDLRVVVVDDQDLVRAGFVALLSGAPGITVAGEAARARRVYGWPAPPTPTSC